jgi:hypothetical protein
LVALIASANSPALTFLQSGSDTLATAIGLPITTAHALWLALIPILVTFAIAIAQIPLRRNPVLQGRASAYARVEWWDLDPRVRDRTLSFSIETAFRSLEPLRVQIEQSAHLDSMIRALWATDVLALPILLEGIWSVDDLSRAWTDHLGSKDRDVRGSGLREAILCVLPIGGAAPESMAAIRDWHTQSHTHAAVIVQGMVDAHEMFGEDAPWRGWLSHPLMAIWGRVRHAARPAAILGIIGSALLLAAQAASAPTFDGLGQGWPWIIHDIRALASIPSWLPLVAAPAALVVIGTLDLVLLLTDLMPQRVSATHEWLSNHRPQAFIAGAIALALLVAVRWATHPAVMWLAFVIVLIATARARQLPRLDGLFWTRLIASAALAEGIGAGWYLGAVLAAVDNYVLRRTRSISWRLVAALATSLLLADWDPLARWPVLAYTDGILVIGLWLSAASANCSKAQAPKVIAATGVLVAAIVRLLTGVLTPDLYSVPDSHSRDLTHWISVVLLVAAFAATAALSAHRKIGWQTSVLCLSALGLVALPQTVGPSLSGDWRVAGMLALLVGGDAWRQSRKASPAIPIAQLLTLASTAAALSYGYASNVWASWDTSSPPFDNVGCFTQLALGLILGGVVLAATRSRQVARRLILAIGLAVCVGAHGTSYSGSGSSGQLSQIFHSVPLDSLASFLGATTAVLIAEWLAWRRYRNVELDVTACVAALFVFAIFGSGSVAPVLTILALGGPIALASRTVGTPRPRDAFEVGLLAGAVFVGLAFRTNPANGLAAVLAMSPLFAVILLVRIPPGTAPASLRLLRARMAVALLRQAWVSLALGSMPLLAIGLALGGNWYVTEQDPPPMQAVFLITTGEMAAALALLSWGLSRWIGSACRLSELAPMHPASQPASNPRTPSAAKQTPASSSGGPTPNSART